MKYKMTNGVTTCQVCHGPSWKINICPADAEATRVARFRGAPKPVLHGPFLEASVTN
jgi:hypothetical protein